MKPEKIYKDHSVAVYIGALQRQLKHPKIRHVINANRVLRYLKLKKPFLRYKKLLGELRLIAVSDSAFQALENDGLAVKGCFILLIEMNNPESPGGKCQIIDFFSRKQSHVCRATFAAELFAVLDAIGHAMKVAALFTEVIYGKKTAEELLDMQDNNQMGLSIHAVVDAKSVLDCVSNQKGKQASDEQLTLHVLKLQELIKMGKLERMWWVDTRDMVTDGLTKGRGGPNGHQCLNRRRCVGRGVPSALFSIREEYMFFV